MLQRPVHKKTPKAVTEKTLGNRTQFFFNTGEKQNNKTADTSFLQNQPVTTRGINNKSFRTKSKQERDNET